LIQRRNRIQKVQIKGQFRQSRHCRDEIKQSSGSGSARKLLQRQALEARDIPAELDEVALAFFVVDDDRFAIQVFALPVNHVGRQLLLRNQLAAVLLSSLSRAVLADFKHLEAGLQIARGQRGNRRPSEFQCRPAS
jgi:hypothetical protein